MKKDTKKKALGLRSGGFSIKEISVLLGVAQSTVSVWVRHVKLGRAAVRRLQKRSKYGKIRGVEVNKTKHNEVMKKIENKACDVFNRFRWNKNLGKILSSFLYWCEGSKQENRLCFTNSDAILIKTFLFLLRQSFVLDESKFRVCLHLHPYHNMQKQTSFWSKVTHIPKTQFIRAYRKSNGGVNIKKNYPGCASIRYHDYKVVKELQFIWEKFGQKYGGVV